MKKRLTFEWDTETDSAFADEHTIETLMKAEDFRLILWELLYNQLRTKHWDYEKESDIAVADFANKLRGEIFEALRERGIEL